MCYFLFKASIFFICRVVEACHRDNMVKAVHRPKDQLQANLVCPQLRVKGKCLVYNCIALAHVKYHHTSLNAIFKLTLKSMRGILKRVVWYFEEGGVLWRGWCATLKRVVWYFEEGGVQEGCVVLWRGWLYQILLFYLYFNRRYPYQQPLQPPQ